ncbi:prepilin peptidase [Pseudoclavibacter sp. CFCC 14310]|uniref:prepilin peptidase n=1 Tax=Pseudoclavibacter sp. CFCC 14310 TaxID=2615180 RepID=UPI001787ADC5|nr:A24 family peptidase [Pseudoclavibacter sp. CFCC 14310]
MTVFLLVVGTTDLSGTVPLACGIERTSIWIATVWFIVIAGAIAVIDMQTRKIPDRIVYPSLVGIGLLYFSVSLSEAACAQEASGTGEPLRVLTAFAGLTTLGGVYLMIAVVSHGSLGLGDVKYAALIGLTLGWHGWNGIVLGLLLPFLFGGAAAAVLLVGGRIGRREAVAFGPWMSLGAFTALSLQLFA